MSIQQNFPAISPSLNLNFARSKTLDPRITFSRTSTATRVNEQGLVEVVSADIPRFDHEYDASTGVVKSLGLLVEEQRSNLETYSSDMSQWSSNGGSFASDDTTAPDGTLTADKLTESSGAFNGRYNGGTITLSTNTTYSIASFIKPVDQPTTRFGIYSGSGWYAFVDTNWDANGNPTTDDSSGASNVKYEPYPNGWYRASFTFTTPSSVSASQQYHQHPDRTASGKSAWFWGAQLEAGAFPTSYIPRPDASTATRTIDRASITGSNFSSWFNNNEFSIFTHHKFPSVPPNYYPRVFDINTGNDAYRMNHYHDPSFNGTRVGCSVVENNSVQYAQATSSYDIGDDLRMASCFKDNDFASYANGTLIGSTDDTGVFTTTQRTVLYIGSTANGGSPLNGAISQLTYYPRRLTNTQLQNLTK